MMKIAIAGASGRMGRTLIEELTGILKQNEIKSVMVARMEVPCCGGIEGAVKRALAASGKLIPWRVVVVTVDGRVLEEQEV